MIAERLLCARVSARAGNRARAVMGQAKMPRITMLLVALLFTGVGAATQDSASEPRTYAMPADASQIAPAGRATSRWQFAAGYQYERIALLGLLNPFGTNGVEVSATRFFSNFVGIEGQFGAGFGTAKTNSSARSYFAGGGPRLAYRGHSRVEPWAHALVGAQQLQITNVILPGSNTAPGWLAGGGVDYHVKPRVAVRVGYDYVGTHFSGAYQRNSKITAEVVWNF